MAPQVFLRRFFSMLRTSELLQKRPSVKKYEDDPEHPGVFKPKGGPQKFVKVSEAIKINQWGGEMNVDAGGYINVTNPDDMYIISGRDFADTYKEKKAEQSAPDAGNQEATGGNN